MIGKEKVSIFWFRRDLRLQDNCGLFHALKGEFQVVPIFIFDKNILEELKDPKDARVSFIHQQIDEINKQLKSKNSRIITFHDRPEKVFQQLTEYFHIQAVYCNRDYEPYAKERDNSIEKWLKTKNISLETSKDQVIFEPDEILKADQSPYLVYTPFSKKWLAELKHSNLESYTSGLQFENWAPLNYKNIIPLEQMGFQQTAINIPSNQLSDHTLKVYDAERNFPDKDSTSKLGVHLRFGTVSVREVAKKAKELSLTFLKELIWREFFMTILYHYPKVVQNNFNPKYDGIKWRNDEAEFQKWCEGKTGFPLVDAGMRELNQTGFMHNRVRMLVASFLTKHLLIDWKWGEAYFAEKLLDYELASNNGNWQWAAGTGVDAAPYFRIFNPETQIKKFDKQHIYIKRWVKEYGSADYPKPMVEHKKARERALETYKAGML